MRIALFAAALTACLFALSACAEKTPPPPVADDATQRTLAQGALIGHVHDNGAHVWRKLPFAAPPEGALRWRAPRPPASWEGVRQALEPAPRCMQLSNRFDEGDGIKPGIILGEEDCLYLDIYAPPDAQGRDLPVMVWIHGGANVWGRGTSYDGAYLAQNEDVIIVSVQYRVGPLGFFAHEWLRDDAEIGEDRAANFATLDLIQSLKWVQGNISAFGGDAGNVTIFGESAGGANVATLMASPLATDLFHRAIIQSGVFGSASLENAESAHPNASTKIADRLGATDADSLRGADPRALFDAYNTGEIGFLEMPTVIQDGVSLAEYPMRKAFASTDSFNAVPVITGTNRDEMKLFYGADPKFIKNRLFMFPAPRDKDLWERFNHYMGRFWRIRSVDGPASNMVAAGHAQVYAYRFDWDEGGKFLLSDFSVLLGAAHAMEIPFVFNNFDFFGPRFDNVMFKKETAASREELSRTMGAYWASFARGGAPLAADAPEWPLWDNDAPTLMRFDSENDGGIEVMAEGDSLERLQRELLNDDAITQDERCMIIEEIVIWEPEIGEGIKAAAGCATA